SALPRKRTCAVRLGMSAMGQKRTSVNELRSCWSRAVFNASAMALSRLDRRSVAASMGRCHRAPRQWRAGGRSRQSPLECCHQWALSSAYFVAFTGRFIHGNEVSPGNLCRELAAVAQLFFHLIDRFANHAQRLAGLELMLNFQQ